MTGTSGRSRAHLRQHFEPAHAGHVDVGQDQDQRRIAISAARASAAGADGANSIVKRPDSQIAPELLTEQRFDIGLVIDDEDVNAQFCASSI